VIWCLLVCCVGHGVLGGQAGRRLSGCVFRGVYARVYMYMWLHVSASSG
jgi:hypothetical protein